MISEAVAMIYEEIMNYVQQLMHGHEEASSISSVASPMKLRRAVSMSR